MPWAKTGNVAMYGGADWSNYKKTVPDCTPEQARRIAILDPTISFFFCAREYMVLTNPAWPGPRTFNPGDAVFFSGEPWWGSAPQCDGYVKTGMSIAYVGSLDSSDPVLAGQYSTAQGLNAVDIVCLFAANLNLATSGDYVRLAPTVPVPAGGTLAVGHDYYIAVFKKSVAALQARGVTVLLSFLNNHDDSGWSQFNPADPADVASAEAFAKQLQAVVETWGFDGIDIDDEYSNGQAYDDSLPMVTTMMRQLMPDLLISKALYADDGPFSGSWSSRTLAQNLTYGWQMSYDDNPQGELPYYVGKGMAPAQLAYGYQGFADTTTEAWLKQNGYAGFMVYDFENDTNQTVMGELVNFWMGAGNWNLNEGSE